jgi:2-methylisocitrate lyase-like PEP mutase family enzyme
MNQIERAVLFKSLHIKGNPLILFNIWDAGSARAVQDAGAKAIATGSWSVAAAQGFEDGEKIPLNLALENVKRIVESVELPVTLDFEGGYAKNPAENAAKVIHAGAIGINFEDQIVDGAGLYSIQDQSERIRAIRKISEDSKVPLFINARTDIFLNADPSTHNEKHLEEAIDRAAAFADAGASGFFAPLLMNIKFIEKLCERSSLPVNLMSYPGLPSTKELAEVGVARISYGPGPYRQMIAALKEAARKAFSEK